MILRLSDEKGRRGEKDLEKQERGEGKRSSEPDGGEGREAGKWGKKG